MYKLKFFTHESFYNGHRKNVYFHLAFIKLSFQTNHTVLLEKEQNFYDKVILLVDEGKAVDIV